MMKETKLPKIGAENYLQFIEDNLVDWFLGGITLTELEKRFETPVAYYDMVLSEKLKFENMSEEEAKEFYRDELIAGVIGYLTVCVDRGIRDYRDML